MPELPVLSGFDVGPALERSGSERICQRGSYVVPRRGNVGCVVPLHREVRTGTLAGIVRQAGLSLDEFQAAVG